MGKIHTLKSYQDFALTKLMKGKSRDELLSYLCMGLAGESGEVIEKVKKSVYHGHPLDLEDAAEELGDLLWYVSTLCSALHLSLDEVAAKNISKLNGRYPDGFSEERSRGRKDK